MALTEGKYAAEFLENESDGDRSRENGIILLGENLKAGHVVGRRVVTPTLAAGVAQAGNTGNGTMNAPTVAANLGVRRGTYTVVFETATLFVVYGPDGQDIGHGAAAAAFANEINFTLTAGGTAWVSGDAFTVSVTGGTLKYREYNPANADGTQRVAGISYGNYDATAADVPGTIIAREAIVALVDLTWFSGATSAQKDYAVEQLLSLLQIASR